MSENNLSKTLEVKDLSIEFRTRNRTVYAVNHLDMEIKKDRRWVLWERQVQEKQLQGWQF